MSSSRPGFSGHGGYLAGEAEVVGSYITKVP
jgi:hypothetical protein